MSGQDGVSYVPSQSVRVSSLLKWRDHGDFSGSSRADRSEVSDD